MKCKKDPTKGSVKGWYYSTKDNWWYHQHRKGLWLLGNKYYVETTRNDFCVKCGKTIPKELIVLVDQKTGKANQE